MKTNKGICNDWYFEELGLEMFSRQCTDVTQSSWSNLYLKETKYNNIALIVRAVNILSSFRGQ